MLVMCLPFDPTTSEELWVPLRRCRLKGMVTYEEPWRRPPARWVVTWSLKLALLEDRCVREERSWGEVAGRHNWIQILNLKGNGRVSQYCIKAVRIQVKE